MERGKALFQLVGTSALALGCQVVDPSPPVDPPENMQDKVVVEPRTQLIPTYPCSSCHKHRAPNPNRRTLVRFHTVRNTKFDHGDTALWCYQCHSAQNPDMLNLPNGRLVGLDEAYRLCVSCHGDKRPDWEDGTHGLTIGYWEGQKVRKSCTHCHDPHYPWNPTLAPEPPPELPRGTGSGTR
jgi:hypothetical protein